jgi:hypothetical protein
LRLCPLVDKIFLSISLVFPYSIFFNIPFASSFHFKDVFQSVFRKFVLKFLKMTLSCYKSFWKDLENMYHRTLD